MILIDVPMQRLLICNRCQSSFVQSVDSLLRLSTDNPLYTGTAAYFDMIHSATGRYTTFVSRPIGM